MLKTISKLTVICLALCSVGAGFAHAGTAELVATFKGEQVTGVSVSADKRVFANFPKWRDGLKYDVVEVHGVNDAQPYPNANWNDWKLGDDIAEDKFISVQSVVAHNAKLYVLDTANPKFKGTIASPRLFVFDLARNDLERTYTFEQGVYKLESYFNDLRVDDKSGQIYITDSSAPGIIVLDIKTGKAKRVLDDSVYTTAEQDHLIIEGKKWGGRPVHSDGIALDTQNDVLYVHALTGYMLYGFKTTDLHADNPEPVVSIRTAAPDGMIVDKAGNLYFADLEEQKIQYLLSDRKTINTLAEGDLIAWADTFSIHGCDLYYTNSRIHESGEDVSDLDYTIYKLAMPSCEAANP